MGATTRKATTARRAVCPMHAGTPGVDHRGDLSCGGELVDVVAAHSKRAGVSVEVWRAAPCSSLLSQGWPVRTPQLVDAQADSRIRFVD